MEYWDLTLSILPPSKVYFTVHSLGSYMLIVNEINERIICLMTFKMIYCPYEDSTQDIQSNIPLCTLKDYWIDFNA